MEARELWTAEDDDTGEIAIVFVMPGSKRVKHHFSMNREFTLELIKDLENRVKFNA